MNGFGSSKDNRHQQIMRNDTTAKQRQLFEDCFRCINELFRFFAEDDRMGPVYNFTKDSRSQTLEPSGWYHPRMAAMKGMEMQ